MPKKRSSDAVTVCVRVRPMNSTEKKDNRKTVTNVDSQRGMVTVEDPTGTEKAKTYTFDNAFSDDISQLEVYNRIARPIVESVLEGYNGTIFAYGQTGTGKTFTMEGVRSNPELKGIIPNSFAHIFGEISKAQGHTQFLVRCSYLEIYCEKVTDLLSNTPKKALKVRERQTDGEVFVEDLSAFVVKSAEEMEKIMTKGNRNRSVGATKMNADSSRSHAIFTVLVERVEKGADGEEHIRMGKLNLVDLAGSERQGKTGAEGQRALEGIEINRSLLTLGNVICTLVNAKGNAHIPYRDSKLTRLLKDSLGGNAKTVMVATFGPADYNYQETLSTLRYANRAKNIKNKPKINEDPKDAKLREYLEQIEALKAQLGNGEEGETDDSSDEEEVIGWDGQPTRRTKRSKDGKKVVVRPISPSKVKQIQAEIDRERDALRAQTNMASEEKEKAEKELSQRQADLERQREERNKLQQQMAAVQSKLVVGGINLVDKAQEQQSLLDQAQAELEDKLKEQERIAQQLDTVEAEQLNIEQKYSSLEEEKEGKTKKLKKIYNMWMATKAEKEELMQDFQDQLKELDEVYSDIALNVQLCDLILSRWVPAEYQQAIENLAVWNEAIGEWQIPALPHTGNNILKVNPQATEPERQEPEPIKDLYESHYLSYDAVMPPTTTERVKTARPTTSRKR
eukprot:TRINITY_DN10419_c0_g1_i5.p1 TRINITY_DN10419_c0_g1~~TRINITY_DN10419_c0_g1_i5.p1  ORF type:complete len:680 (+),score=163.12 TRINITY_DN10419_c0_g1_i5:89-2128(+)